MLILARLVDGDQQRDLISELDELDACCGVGVNRAMANRKYPFVSQMRLQGRAEGLAEGLVVAIFKTLDRREIAVDDESRTRIKSCSDPDTLEVWLDWSFTVTSVGELFTQS